MLILILICIISLVTSGAAILMTYWLKDNSKVQIAFAYVGFCAICTFGLSAALLML